jgi:hypothetical protein
MVPDKFLSRPLDTVSPAQPNKSSQSHPIPTATQVVTVSKTSRTSSGPVYLLWSYRPVMVKIRKYDTAFGAYKLKRGLMSLATRAALMG